MKAINWHVHGQLMVENGRSALLLNDWQPEDRSPDSLYLRFAFVTQGREEMVFPAFLLDDWGQEIRGLRLYKWVAENGEQFPRGNLFGFAQEGEETQHFLRELELYARYPTFAFTEKMESVAEGQMVDAVLLPTPAVVEPVQVKAPGGMKRPLAHARVTWWHVPAPFSHFDFSLLSKPDPGF